MSFNKKFEPVINRWKKSNPLACHYLGFHEYDGILPSYDNDFVIQRVKEIKSDISYLNEINKEFNENKLDLFELLKDQNIISDIL